MDIDILALLISEDVDNPVLVEDLRSHLDKHYGDYVPPDQIDKAVQNPRFAVKLLYGLYKGVIQDVEEPGAEDKVASLKPVQPAKGIKQAGKSDQEREFERLKADARSISATYWPWIVRLRRTNPEIEIDEGIFDYLEHEGISLDDIKDQDYGVIAQQSEVWHKEQLENREEGGVYEVGPEDPRSMRVGNFWLVPVTEEDARLEGTKMQNCISGAHVSNQSTGRIYSMRNRFNNPHVSIQIKNEQVGEGRGWVTAQIKGKQNRTPHEKYIQPLLDCLEFLTSKSEPLGQRVYVGGSDFWRILADSGDDEAKWLFRCAEPIKALDRRPHLLDTMSQEHVDHVLLNMANSVRDTTMEKLVQVASDDAVQQRVKMANPPELMLVLLKSGRLTEEEALAAADSGSMRRSGQMIVKSIYHPDELLLEIESVDVDDFILAYENYKHAVQSYQGTSPVFSNALAHAYKHSIGKASMKEDLMAASPTQDLLQLMPTIMSDSSASGEDIRKLFAGVIVARDDAPVAAKVQAILGHASFESTGYWSPKEFKRLVSNWLLSRTEDELREVYELAPEGHLLKHWSGQAALAVAGVHHDWEDKAPELIDKIERTDDPNELKKLHDKIPKKGPGELLRLRKYVLHKIAWLNSKEAIS